MKFAAIRSASLVAGHSPVTPLAGVWVEISVIGLSFGNERVTPLAGVWVEICPDGVPVLS